MFPRALYTAIYKASGLPPHSVADAAHSLEVRSSVRISASGANRGSHVTPEEQGNFG